MYLSIILKHGLKNLYKKKETIQNLYTVFHITKVTISYLTILI